MTPQASAVAVARNVGVLAATAPKTRDADHAAKTVRLNWVPAADATPTLPQAWWYQAQARLEFVRGKTASTARRSGRWTAGARRRRTRRSQFSVAFPWGASSQGGASHFEHQTASQKSWKPSRRHQ